MVLFNKQADGGKSEREEMKECKAARNEVEVRLRGYSGREELEESEAGREEMEESEA